MSNQLTTFNFGPNAVRVVEIGGDPWFVAADVCRALHLCVRQDGRINTNGALLKLAADEKQNLPHAEAKRNGLQAIASNAYGVALISEPGLYKLIARSSKPEAKAFDRWVRHDVLPAIRKTGAYSSEPHVPAAQPQAAMRTLFPHLDQETLNTFARLLVATVDAARGGAVQTTALPSADATPAKRREIKAEDLKPFLTARMVAQRWPEASGLTAPPLGQKLAELSVKGGYATEKTGPNPCCDFCSEFSNYKTIALV